jgi:hypothetical protein
MTAYARRRDFAEANLGGACARCGSTGGPFAIDHINGGRQGVRESGRRATVDAVRDAAAGRTANLQLLCRFGAALDCHWIKGAEDRRSGYLA